MKNAWKARRAKREGKHKSGCCCCCKKSKDKSKAMEKIDKPLVDPLEYPGGEADVLAANRHNDFSFEELVSIVHCTEDTLFAFDPAVIYSFFDYIDKDGNGSLSPRELREAAKSVSLSFENI
jgi:hypothetical protein